MARAFTSASSHRINLSLGAGASLTGAVTIAAILRRASNGLASVLNIGNSASTSILMDFSGADLLRIRIGNTFLPASAGTITSSTGWVCCVITKPAGTTAAKFHWYPYATNTWTHDLPVNTAGNASPATSSAFGVRQDTSAAFFNGDIAMGAVWGAELTSAQTEALAFSLPAWFQVQPNGLWLLDQASTSMLVGDLTGNGANQSGITGTSVSPLSVPTFSYGHPDSRYTIRTDEVSTTTTTATVIARVFTPMHLGKRRAVSSRSRHIRRHGDEFGSAPIPIPPEPDLGTTIGDWDASITANITEGGEFGGYFEYTLDPETAVAPWDSVTGIFFTWTDSATGFLSGTRTINSLNVIDYIDVDASPNAPFLVPPEIGALHNWYFVFKLDVLPTAAQTIFYIVGSPPGSTYLSAIAYDDAGTTKLGLHAWQLDGGTIANEIRTSAVTLDTDTHVVCIAEAGANSRLFLDGVEVSLGAKPSGWDAYFADFTTNGVVGFHPLYGQSGVGFDTRVDGAFCQFVIADTTDAQRTERTAELMTKWGI